jgi:hypothetical protein
MPQRRPLYSPILTYTHLHACILITYSVLKPREREQEVCVFFVFLTISKNVQHKSLYGFEPILYSCPLPIIARVLAMILDLGRVSK